MRNRRSSTKSGASSVGLGDDADGARVSKKTKAPAHEQKPRGVSCQLLSPCLAGFKPDTFLQVTYKELLTAEIPEEEDDNYDSDIDPPFIPPAIPDPDFDYDEYSDGEIPEGELICAV